MSIHFVVDSTLDVPAEYLEKLNITVLPAFVNYGGNSYADNGVELRREQFYTDLGTMENVPSTAAPSPGLAKEIIHSAFQGAGHLFLMSLSKKLSGIYNVMHLTAQELPPQNITVIDTNSISMAAGFQALAGAQVAADGGSVTDIMHAIENVRQKQSLYAGMQSVEFLKRGGRVNRAVGTMGTLLKIRPIVSVEDGDVKSAGTVRRRTAWLDSLEKFARQQAPLESVAFLHTHNMSDLNELRERIADITPANTVTTYATPSIGVHTGPGAIGLAMVRQ